MEPLALVLGITTLLLAFAVIAGLWRLDARVTALRHRLGATPVLPPNGRQRPAIAIEILNPFELATRESKLAASASALAPWVIKRIVYQRTTEILARQLKERGVEAQIRVCGLTENEDAG